MSIDLPTEIEYHLTPSIAKTAVRHFLVRRFGRPVAAFTALAVLAALYELVSSLEGSVGWTEGAAAGGIATMGIVLASTLFRYYRRASQSVATMSDRRIVVIVSEDAIGPTANLPDEIQRFIARAAAQSGGSVN